MIRPDFARWGQTADDILRLATESAHHRDRERYLALYMIGTKQTNATRWAEKIGRQNVTVMTWVHAYNAKGPEGARWQHSGGRRPLFVQLGNAADHHGDHRQTLRIYPAQRARSHGVVDRQAFTSHFTAGAANEGVVAFENLDGDAILGAPSPRGPDFACGHIAAFVRNAPARQPHCFWRAVGQTVQRALADRPC